MSELESIERLERTDGSPILAQGRVRDQVSMKRRAKGRRRR
jgi:hypothetical protein